MGLSGSGTVGLSVSGIVGLSVSGTVGLAGSGTVGLAGRGAVGLEDVLLWPAPVQKVQVPQQGGVFTGPGVSGLLGHHLPLVAGVSHMA